MNEFLIQCLTQKLSEILDSPLVFKCKGSIFGSSNTGLIQPVLTTVLVYVQIKYTFCCLLPENILSLMLTSNSLIQKYIHFIQSTFTSVDMQPFASKGLLLCQQMTISTISLYIRDNKISIMQGKYLA